MSSVKPTPIMQALTAAMSAGPPRYQGDAFHKPRYQDFYSFSPDGTCEALSETQSGATSDPNINPQTICLLSWNIDVLVPFAEERMSAALRYLETLVSSTATDVPIVVFLQEMCPSDLTQIRTSPWIHQRFHLTDIDGRNWLSPYYGTTTLIDRRLSIKSVFRVPWISKFDRDGLFVDLELCGNSVLGGDERVLRLCNTHLESLVADPPVRPQQLKLASVYLQELNVASALLAGDLNAIQPFDRTLHTENNLKDTYLELGGAEDSDEGYTWGYQSPQWMQDKFGCSRMDKILYRGDLEPKTLRRIGMGIKVDDEHIVKVKEAGELDWVTDHYGVMGQFELTEGWSLGQACSSAKVPRPKLS
jgi:tyrosyl-DNA phosphodiesterase 2